MANLVYFCVFYNKDYFKLLDLLLMSLKFYSTTNSFDLLVLTSPEFKGSVQELSSKFDLKIQTMTINLTTIFQAACARLNIFSYENISKYQKILYLDTDIIIKGDLAQIFNIEIKDVLYGIESGYINSPSFGNQFFNFKNIDSAKTGINSGTLLFNNCLNIRDLFSRIQGHINAFTDAGQAAPYCMDQPFINFHAIRNGLYNNQILNPYVSLFEGVDEVPNYATSIVCHFSYPIGNMWNKYDRMNKFLIKLINSTSTAIQSPDALISKIIHPTDIKLGLSLLSSSRLNNLFYQCAKFRNTDYSFIECGVAKGGALAIMKYAARSNNIFGFDSFEGMPDITEKDIGEYNRSNPLTDFGKVGDNLSGGIETVYNSFKTLNLPMENVHLVKGFFNDTLKVNKAKCGKIAVLRIDADWYESCKVCLEELYDQVIDGGVIIIDDYGHFIGAKRATDEFRASRSIVAPLIQTDYTEFYWIKPGPIENSIIGKSYSWGNGSIRFTNSCLETTWGKGIYEVRGDYISANWNNHNHILKFNSDYTQFVGFRTKPADLVFCKGGLAIYNITLYLQSKGYNRFEGYSQQVPEQVKDLINLVKSDSVKNIMEIGFNAGHSAEIILQSNKNAKLVSFDLGYYGYNLVAKEYIDTTFPGRHTLILGNSVTEVPKFTLENPNAKFDIIFVDGGHEYSVANSDLENCFKLAHKDTIVILDDTMFVKEWVQAYNEGPNRTWTEHLDSNRVSEICRKDYCNGRGMAWGKYVFNTSAA
jgi:O-methyltransferase